MTIFLLCQLSGQGVFQDFGSQVLQPSVALFVVNWQRFILWSHQIWLRLLICAVLSASSAFLVARLASFLVISVQLLRYTVLMEFMATFEHDERLHARRLPLVITKVDCHALILVICSAQIEGEDA